MRLFLKIMVILILTSCSSGTEINDEQSSAKGTLNDTIQNSISTIPVLLLDSTIHVNKLDFNIQLEDHDKEFYLLNANSVLLDTLHFFSFAGFELTDINNDKFNDLVIVHTSNRTIDTQYLFDPITNTFKKLESAFICSSVLQLKANPAYYCSYHSAGCADDKWVSDLFKIENFKTIQLGHMCGMGCKNEPQVIEIYKVRNNDEEHQQLLEKLSYAANIPTFEDKGDFMEKYWNKNFANFR